MGREEDGVVSQVSFNCVPYQGTEQLNIHENLLWSSHERFFNQILSVRLLVKLSV